MKKRFEFYWPIFNILGIILVLWSLTAIKITPDHDIRKEALLDSTYNESIYEAELNERIPFGRVTSEELIYPMAKKETKLVINF